MSVEDAAGNTASTTTTVNVDTTAPTLTVDAPDNTNDTTPTITGTTDAEDGTQITITVTDANGDTQTFTATAQNGTYAAEVPNALPEGSYSVSASITDAAGNTATAADSSNVIDTAISNPNDPANPVTAGLDSSSDSGTVGDNLTNDNTPTISGTTEPGATVTISYTDAQGNSQTQSTTADANGNYSIEITNPLADGSNDITVSVEDAAGNTASTTTTVNVDTQADEGRVTVDPIAGDNVINAEEAGEQTQTVSGTAQGGDIAEGDTVTVTVNGNDYTTTVQNDGTWSVDVATSDLIADNSVDVSVASIDAAGNSVTSTASTSVSVDTVPGNLPNGEPMAAPQVSIVDDTNNDGTINANEKDSEVNFEISMPEGVEAGDTLNVNVNGTVTSVEITQNMIDAGKYEGVTTTPDEGQSVVITASITDKQGNTTESSSDSVQVDTVFGDGETLGKLAITDITDNNGDYSSVTMQGTGAIPGDTIKLFYNGGTNASDGEFDNTQEPATDNGHVVTTTVNADGTWSIDISNLDKTPVDDNEFFSVVEYDKDGNSIATDTTHYFHGTYNPASLESADDFVLTGAGNDTIKAEVDDTNDYVVIDGGNGHDVVEFNGNIGDYDIVRQDTDTIIVTKKGTESDSDNNGIGDVYELRNVENLQFGNEAYRVSEDGSIQRWVPEINNVTVDTLTIGTSGNDTHADISDWGVIENGKAVFIQGDVTITTSVFDGDGKQSTLTAWNDHRQLFGQDIGIHKDHIGVGIGDNDDEGLSKGETLVVDIDGANVNKVEFTLDGLGSYFDKDSAYATEVKITAYDADGNIIDIQGGYRDSGSYSDTYSFETDVPVAKFELTTEGGNGTFVVQNMTLSATDTIKIPGHWENVDAENTAQVNELNDGNSLVMEENASIDFGKLAENVENLTQIHMNEGVKLLSLKLDDVLNITGKGNTLVIHGDDSDSVTLKGNWEKGDTQAVDGNEFTVYQGCGADGSTASVLIDINQNNIHIDES